MPRNSVNSCGVLRHDCSKEKGYNLKKGIEQLQNHAHLPFDPTIPRSGVSSGHISQQYRDTVCAKLLTAALAVSANTGPYLDNQGSLKKPLCVHSGKNSSSNTQQVV